MTRAPERIRTALKEQWKRPTRDHVYLTLPFPPSVNRLWTPRAGGMHRSRRYETWARAAGNAINEQRPCRVQGPYQLSLAIEDKSHNRPDLGNLEKCISDILQEHSIIDNDALATAIHIYWHPTIKGALVTISADRCSSSLSPARRAVAA